MHISNRNEGSAATMSLWSVNRYGFACVKRSINTSFLQDGTQLVGLSVSSSGALGSKGVAAILNCVSYGVGNSLAGVAHVVGACLNVSD